MSPRAAARLETIGFEHVYDYVLGKSDWMAAGSPTEGTSADIQVANEAVRGGDVTCSLQDRLADVAGRVKSAGRDVAIVVDQQQIVIGRVRGRSLGGKPDALIEDVMRSGPATVRPNTSLEDVVSMLRDANVKSTLVTTPDGKLIGTLYLEDAERLLQ